jgi:membrane-bound metal-dependent hydrolase YbcI (DUF457 family)
MQTSGDLMFLPGDCKGEVDASNFRAAVLAEHASHVNLTPVTVWVVGPIKIAVDRDWVVSVATYDRQVSLLIIYILVAFLTQLILTEPYKQSVRSLRKSSYAGQGNLGVCLRDPFWNYNV